MNYSYHCKNCGDTFFSNDKREVIAYRHKHRKTTLIGGVRKVVESCPMVPVGDGTIARPALAKFLNEKKEKDAQ